MSCDYFYNHKTFKHNHMKYINLIILILSTNTIFAQIEFLDSTFNQSGIISTFGGFNSLHILDNNKTIVIGSFNINQNYRRISMLHEDGSIDNSFIDIIDQLQKGGSTFKSFITKENKILLVKNFYNKQSNDPWERSDDLLIARLLPDGRLDKTFSKQGFRTLDFARIWRGHYWIDRTQDYAANIAEQSD